MTAENDTVYALPSRPNIEYTELFSMTAQKVYEMVQTKSTYKSFTRSDLGVCSLIISGELTNSENTEEIKVGVCYYNAFSGIFEDVTDDRFQCGVDDCSASYPPSYFSNYRTYYGYITNVSGYGYVSGTLTFYKMNTSLETNSVGDGTANE